MSNSNNITSKILTGATVVALVFALNVSGALAGFFRTLDGVSDTNVPSPLEFLFGFGTDGTTTGYGYGYGYGNGDFDAGFPVEEEEDEAPATPTVGGGSGTAGGSGGWSSSNWGGSSSGGWSGGSSNTPSVDPTDNTDPTDNDTVIPTSPVEEDTTVTPVTPVDTSSIAYRDYSSQPRLATCGLSIVDFSDISGNTFEDYINRLEQISGLNWNGSGTEFTIYTPESTVFEPNRGATRSEYVKMILRALCIDYSNENSTLDDFNDGAVDSWQAKVVNKAAELGLISTTNSEFRVNATISRAEALKMVMRAGIDSSFSIVPTSSSYSDVSLWSWQSRYTEVARALGVIAPNPTFRPGDAITRGESTKFILNGLNID